MPIDSETSWTTVCSVAVNKWEANCSTPPSSKRLVCPMIYFWFFFFFLIRNSTEYSSVLSYPVLVLCWALSSEGKCPRGSVCVCGWVCALFCCRSTETSCFEHYWPTRDKLLKPDFKSRVFLCKTMLRDGAYLKSTVRDSAAQLFLRNSSWLTLHQPDKETQICSPPGSELRDPPKSFLPSAVGRGLCPVGRWF